MKKKKEDLKQRIAGFMQQYQRKKHPSHDPNDRGYDRKIEKLIKKMDPKDLDELLNE